MKRLKECGELTYIEKAIISFFRHAQEVKNKQKLNTTSLSEKTANLNYN